MRLNCWEFKRCGRQPGGEKVQELGVCCASIEDRAHGLNSGINGGRCCWAVAGTLCGGSKQGSFSAKLGGCLNCDFYNLVRQEQGVDYKSTKEILLELKNKTLFRK